MISKLHDHLAYPPRAMRAERASAYLSLSRSKFLELVEQGKLPQPGSGGCEEDEMRPGNLVRLKSGGPIMTVKMIVDARASSNTFYAIGIRCTWFDKVDQCHDACFSECQLEDAAKG